MNKLTTAPPEKKLAITAQNQLQSNWCWAAVASMCANYYYPIPRSQCEIASTFYNVGCCPDVPECNMSVKIDQLEEVFGQEGMSYQVRRNQTMSKEELMQSLGVDQNPLVLVMQNPAGGHFVLAYGYMIRRNVLYVWIVDPGPRGAFAMRYESLASGESGLGIWLDTLIVSGATAPSL